jgi:parallel beta-helix repeat protein
MSVIAELIVYGTLNGTSPKKKGVGVGMKVILLILVTFCGPSHADAAIYYVSPGGLDSHTCAQAQSTATPKRSVANAKGCGRAGDTIQMRGGTYDEGQVLWFDGPSGTSWSAPITLENYHGERPVWNMPPSVSNWSQLVFRNTHYIIIRGITFDGTNGSNSLMRGGYTDLPVRGGYAFISLECNNDPVGCSEHFRIENNEMRNTAYGAIIGGNHSEIRNNYIHHIAKVSNSIGIYNAGNSVTVENNLFEDIAGSPINYWSNSGTGANNGIARHNKIVRAGYFWAPTSENGNLPGTGRPRIAQGTYSNRSPGIFVSRGRNIQVYNNIIIDSAGGIAVRYGASNCRIQNNTIFVKRDSSDGYGGIQFDKNTSNCVASGNIIWEEGSNQAIQNNVPGGGGHVLYNNLATALEGPLNK